MRELLLLSLPLVRLELLEEAVDCTLQLLSALGRPRRGRRRRQRQPQRLLGLERRLEGRGRLEDDVRRRGGGGGGGGSIGRHAAEAHLGHHAEPLERGPQPRLRGAVRHVDGKERALRGKLGVGRLAGVQARKQRRVEGAARDLNAQRRVRRGHGCCCVDARLGFEMEVV